MRILLFHVILLIPTLVSADNNSVVFRMGNFSQGFYRVSLVSEERSLVIIDSKGQPFKLEVFLTDGQLNDIVAEAKVLKFFSVPELPQLETNGVEYSNYTDFFIQIKNGDVTHGVEWSTRYREDAEWIDNMNRLAGFIRDVIESTDAYNRLPFTVSWPYVLPTN